MLICGFLVHAPWCTPKWAEKAAGGDLQTENADPPPSGPLRPPDLRIGQGGAPNSTCSGERRRATTPPPKNPGPFNTVRAWFTGTGTLSPPAFSPVETTPTPKPSPDSSEGPPRPSDRGHTEPTVSRDPETSNVTSNR